MKQWVIQLLETLIHYLDSGYVPPTQRMNYRKCVEVINSQSDSGRCSFYAILLTYATEEDKRYIKKLLDEGVPRPLRKLVNNS
jgi:hypothetical protein